MADDRTNPFVKGQLKVEATDWWIMMHSADAEQHRAEFEQWLSRGALHLAAYNRVANLYGQGKQVSWDALPPPRPVRGRIRMAILAAIGALMLLGFFCWRILSVPAPVTVASGLPSSVARLKPSQIAQFVTQLGEIRRVRLGDGSLLVLDTDTLLTVNLARDRRRLRLEHGRARFEVAHERRPFIVDAGDSEIVAHGTIFDVANWQDGIHIHLVRGSIGVRRSVSGRVDGHVETAELRPGEGLAYPLMATKPAPLKPAAEPVSDWPDGNIDFAESPLDEVVRTANRYSSVKIVLAQSGLHDLRVSGIYHPGDNRKLANSMASLFGLAVADNGDQIVIGRLQN